MDVQEPKEPFCDQITSVAHAAAMMAFVLATAGIMCFTTP